MSLNGDGIEVFHQPSSHSDGDSFVVFRRANVIVTGDLFDTRRFPVIHSGEGGTIQGVLDGLNRLLELAIPPYPQPWLGERTYLVPGHGRISDSHDLLEYRDMVTIVRDIIQDMIDRGMTLDQVKAANPTRGYNARYGATTGDWTTEMFVTAVYRGLTRRPGAIGERP
jgi:glyoxylase-like metal-dependent hydrolase (beta-lactamase superfamily II)